MKTKTLVGTIATLLSGTLQAQDKPNVIIILADDLGYGDVSAYGAQKISTPNIDYLAGNGVQLMDGHSTSATSTPSRYALMTGKYPWRNPKAKILPGDAPLIISETEYTLPKMMQTAGYKTGAIGKWHLGMGKGNVNWNETVDPAANEIGFDYSHLIAATNDRVPTVYVENGNVVGLNPNDPIQVSYQENFPGEPTALSHPHMLKMKWSDGHNCSIVNGIPRIGYMKGGKEALWVDEQMADYFLNKVFQFIDQNKEQPFFLYYGLHQPHVPRAPHPRFIGSSGLGPRGDVIIEADWCVGELISKLKEEGLLENTLIIFSSDNGPVLDDGYQDQAAEMLQGHDPQGGYRGGKYSLFEAGTRVPFIAYWKGKIEPTQSHALICQMDLMASLAQLLGITLPQGLDSQNLLSPLLGQSTKGRKNLILEAEGRLALRSDNYVLVPPYEGKERNNTGNELGNLSLITLYDLDKDPKQRINRAKKEPRITETLYKNLKDLTTGYSIKIPY